MDGDFKGDFTRDSFDPFRRFSRVFMQQGRVQLDADWNEQADHFLYALRTFISDLVGPRWGTFDFDIDPQANQGSGGIKPNSIKPNSFKIEQRKDTNNRVIPHDFLIGGGHYYVGGILCENTPPEDAASIAYTSQQPKPAPLGDGRYWVYLDVWERQVTFLEDPDMREVALGENGPDTATRAEVVWQVKTSNVPSIPDDIDRFGPDGKDASNAFLRINQIEDATQKLEVLLQPQFRGALKARSKVPPDTNGDPCIIPPDSRFRGNENQLYRVEVHTGGTRETATFKWSRENGSVVYPIDKLEGKTVTVGSLGRDDRFTLESGDWVEIVDDDYLLQIAALQGPGSTPPLQGSINPLLQVEKIEQTTVTLKGTLTGAPSLGVGQDPKKHPLLRRWDQRDGSGKKGETPKLAQDGSGTINIVEDMSEDGWITLEDGVQIQFQPSGKTNTTPPTDNPPMMYRTGDYWLVPARTITGDVVWPQETEPKTGMPYESGHPQALPPHGVQHYYALLAVVSLGGNNLPPVDLRYIVPPLGKMALFLDVNLFRQAGL